MHLYKAILKTALDFFALIGYNEAYTNYMEGFVYG